jgi:hypothetical protein
MVPEETRSVGAGAQGYFWSPPKFFQDRIGFPLDGIGDNFPEHRRKLKSVSAIACGNY